MKRALIIFLLGVVAGAGGFWYYEQNRTSPALENAKDSVVSGAGKVKEAIQEQFSDLSAEELKRELERTGMVVREKASQAGTAIADATVNARTSTAIKTKLFSDLGKAALSINVDTTDGLVTLSGTAATHEEIAKAVKIAMETEGVRKVVSTMQVKPAQ